MPLDPKPTANRLHEIIAEQPEMHPTADPAAIESALKSAFQQADKEIIQRAEKQGKRYGTTAVCALFLGSQLYVAHAGDSRAVLCREDKAVRLTKDHKPASNVEERERIEALGGTIMYKDDRVVSNPEAGGPQSRLNMSRALGDAGHKFPVKLVEAEPTVVHLYLTPGRDHFVVLGTDGVFDVMGAGDCCTVVQRSMDSMQSREGDAAAGEAARALVQEALRRGTADNVTAAVALLNWE